jgi:N-formylglutamate amidohydrolase
MILGAPKAKNGQKYLEKAAERRSAHFLRAPWARAADDAKREVQHDVSVELQVILQAHDGHSRSIPARANGGLLHEPGIAQPLLDS